MNTVNLIGRLTRDPKIKTIGQEYPMVLFSIAVDDRFKRDEANFFDCKAFGKTGSIIHQYVGKGREVGITGRLCHDRWETEDGQKRSRVTVTVEHVTLLGRPEPKPEPESQPEKEDIF